MKPRPLVTIDDDGHFRVRIADRAFLTWWEGDNGHFFVRLICPSSARIIDTYDGYDADLTTRH